MRMTFPPPVTHRLPSPSKARPPGPSIPVISSAAVGMPELAICVKSNITTLSAHTTVLHRFPSRSKASTLGPGDPPPNDGLSMVMSGVLGPEVASEAAG